MRDTPVRDAMTTNPITVVPDTPIGDAIGLLAAHGLSSLPVVDADGHYLGFLSDEDIIIEYAELPEPAFIEFLGAYVEVPGSLKRFGKEFRKLAAATVGEAMDPDEKCIISPDDTVEAAATRMVFKHLHRLAVCDADGSLVGLIARSDIVAQIAAETAAGPTEPDSTGDDA